MRSVLAVLVVGMLVPSAHADPFAVRNPVPDAAASPAPAPEPKSQVIDRGKRQRHAGIWTAVGGVGLVAGSFAISQYSSVRYHAAVDRLETSRSQADVDEANHWAGVARLYGTSLFLMGSVTVGVGAYLYFSAPEKIRKERIAVVPAIGGDTVGLSVSGGF